MDNGFPKIFYVVWALATIGVANMGVVVDVVYWTGYANRGGSGGFPVYTLIACYVGVALSVMLHVIYILQRWIRRLSTPKMHPVHIVLLVLSLVPVTYVFLAIPGFLISASLVS